MCQETDHYLIRWLNIRQCAQHQGDVGATTQATLQADTISLLSSSSYGPSLQSWCGPKRGGEGEGGEINSKHLHFPGMYETTLWEWMGAAAWGADLMSVPECFRGRYFKKNNNFCIIYLHSEYIHIKLTLHPTDFRLFTVLLEPRRSCDFPTDGGVEMSLGYSKIILVSRDASLIFPFWEMLWTLLCVTEVQRVQHRFCPCFSHLTAAFAPCPMREKKSILQHFIKSPPSILYTARLSAPADCSSEYQDNQCWWLSDCGLWRQHAAFLLCFFLFVCFISEHPSPRIKESLPIPFTDAYKWAGIKVCKPGRRTATCTRHWLACMLKLTNGEAQSRIQPAKTVGQSGVSSNSMADPSKNELNRCCRGSWNTALPALSWSRNCFLRNRLAHSPEEGTWGCCYDASLPSLGCSPISIRNCSPPRTVSTAALLLLPHTLTYTHTHTCARSLILWLPPPLFLQIPSSTSSLYSFYPCHWEDPPISPSSYHHLSVSFLSRPFGLSLPSQLYDAAHKEPYRAVRPCPPTDTIMCAQQPSL